MPTCLGSSAPEDLNCLAPIQAAQNEIHFFPASEPAPVENLSGQGNQNEKVKDAAVNQEDHKDPFYFVMVILLVIFVLMPITQRRQLYYKVYKNEKNTSLADLALESEADKHEESFAKHKEESDEVDQHQLGEGEDVSLDIADNRGKK